MGRALALREDFTGPDLRRLARASRDADQTRRLLALAVIYDGVSRGDAAKTGGVGRQIIRDWVERFTADGPDGLITRKAPGPPSKLDDGHRAALVEVVERGPDPELDGVVRWRLLDLAAWVWDSFGISVSEATLSRELGSLGFSKLPARPRHHDHDPDVMDAFEKTSPPAWRRPGHASRLGPEQSCGFKTRPGSGRRTRSPAPLGRLLCNRLPGNGWARRGTRPSASQDQRTQSACIFGVICPAEGKGAGLVMPRCDSEAMTAHFAEISATVAPGAHAVVILDQAGWHLSDSLAIPANITLLPFAVARTGTEPHLSGM